MKRNWDLIRKILIQLEEKADSTSWLQDDQIKGYDSALSLTWNGHEFIDKIRNDSVWNKVKSTVQSKSLDLSFDVIKQVATSLISSILT